VLDAVGSLYGATSSGGMANEGTIFQLRPGKGKQWGYSVLYSFCETTGCPDGASPSDVAFDSTGNLLGVAGGGGGQTGCGNNSGCGVLFRLSQNGDGWAEDVLHPFCPTEGCPDGSDPVAAPISATANVQFGTTLYGGGNNSDPDGKGGGVLFERSDRFRVHHRFCSLPQCADGAYPYGKLVGDAQGHVFGVTHKGGANGAGVIYEFTP
jgi:uncharacterized repeat protein (TIGR03803 family)